MDFSFIEIKTLLLIVHLMGLALGVGGAFISDIIFFKAIHDWRISKTEMEFLHLGGLVVSIGLILLIISGLTMFSLEAERYLASTKFIAKMVIVAILAANAILLHNLHIPHMKHISKKGVSTRTGFAKNRILILTSGVVSVVSWLSALVLGAFRSIPWSVEMILSIYTCVLLVGITIAFILRDRLMPIQR